MSLVTQVFACESNPSKQRFIRDNFGDLNVLFADICDLGNDSAWCILSGRDVLVPRSDVAFIGFSCKSASSLNIARSTLCEYLAQADLDRAGSTGSTLKGLLGYLWRHRPALVFLENVAGILTRTRFGTPMDAIKRLFTTCGYELEWAFVNSSDYMLPQRRRRVWMWASLKSECALDGTLSLLRQLRLDSIPVALFLDVSEAEVGAAVASVTRAPKMKVFKWRASHAAFQKRHRLVEFLGIDSQWFVRLSERERDVLRLYYALFARQGVDLRSVDWFLDVSQGIGRVPVGRGICPCLCPNGRVWSTLRGRLLTGREKMSLQGLVCGDDYPAWQSFSDRQLSDLAGNAFSTTVCLAVFVSVFATVTFH